MIYGEYTHVRCKCGGIIGMRDKENFSCNRCGKIYDIGYLGKEYDELMTNEKTGWIFPMVKKEELMKVWITKYALTDGIIEAQQIPGSAYDGKEYAFFLGKNNQYVTDFYIPYEELFWDKNSAIVKAEEMRQYKIASLKNQIEKLEKMRFE